MHIFVPKVCGLRQE